MLFRCPLRPFALLSLPVLLALGGPGCTPNERTPPKPPLLNERNLDSTRFVVRPGRDTLLRTAGGTLLFIPRNGFQRPDGTPAGGPVHVTLREALTPADLVLAHLTTTSDGRMLESGGMVFVDANEAGQTLRINPGAPLRVSLPTAQPLRGMQVFTGRPDAAGRLNWVNPVPLADTALANRMALGARLFRTHCAVCHGLDSLVAGPPLANVHTRRGQYWLHAFIHNSQRLIEAGDPVAVALFKRHNFTAMPPFDFTPRETGAILTYLSGGSFRADSLEVLPNGDVADSLLGLPPPAKPFPAELYYVFDLKDLGWINVDRFPDQTTPRVPFFVQLGGEQFEEVTVTLLFKAEKIFLAAWPAEDGRYTFSPTDDEDASLLPAGRKATVVVTAYKGETCYLGLQEVTIGQKETVTVAPARTTPKQLVQTLKARL
jgi:mono/diheme cytochrome c family protein